MVLVQIPITMEKNKEWVFVVKTLVKMEPNKKRMSFDQTPRKSNQM